MNIEQARFNMIEQQIRPWEVLDPQVLDLLFVVKREDFVPPAYRNLAFADMEIPIGSGQVMLAPRVEARLMQELAIKNTDKVLEIGTGSGYMAALLAACADQVVTVESRPEIADFARQNLERAGVANVTIEIGDGANGWSQRGPYDAIVVSGALPSLPDALLKQLRLGGRLAAIVGEAPVMEAQLVTCSAEGVYNTVNLFETVVPKLDSGNAKPGFSF
ncbi:MAG TPA: protein-L-isoaspartate O-methyltransferase [Azonexus sp.]|jgi:protein-L-isoaspartate(D-aspartate) O-methyltransferase|nr:protein-L-isoaspartate O-methyltransferase [Azonexus sp.]